MEFTVSVSEQRGDEWSWWALWARGIDGQRFRPIDDPGTSVGKANSCDHTARSNLKWELVALDGGLSVCRMVLLPSFGQGIKPRL